MTVESTLDIFYLAQIAAGIYRSSNQLEGDFPSPDNFEEFYAEHSQLLDPEAWREYYSPAFLASPISARFYRLPNLQDLPDSSDPLAQPRRQKGAGHFTKLPRWAYNVMRTRRRQSALSTARMTEIALATLRQTIERQREEHPGVVAPYSETKARFWLGYMKVESLESLEPQPVEAWDPNEFGVHAARGAFDVWAWEAYYSKERWDSADDRPPLEPDLDGTRKSEVEWCGLPDGGAGFFAWCRGWEPEVGSEEEVAFLAAVAAKETEEVATSSSNSGFDYSIRSHILLGLLFAAFETTERERLVEDLKRRVVEAGRLDESKVEEWTRQALIVMEPYVHEREQHERPVFEEDLRGLLRRVLTDNGQLFARWKLSPTSKESVFALKPRQQANIASMEAVET